MHKVLAVFGALTAAGLIAFLFFFAPLANSDGLAGRRADAIRDARNELQMEQTTHQN